MDSNHDKAIEFYYEKASRSLLISLECLNVDGLFDVVITGDDVTEPKASTRRNKEGIGTAKH